MFVCFFFVFFFYILLSLLFVFHRAHTLSQTKPIAWNKGQLLNVVTLRQDSVNSSINLCLYGNGRYLYMCVCGGYLYWFRTPVMFINIWWQYFTLNRRMDGWMNGLPGCLYGWLVGFVGIPAIDVRSLKNAGNTINCWYFPSSSYSSRNWLFPLAYSAINLMWHNLGKKRIGIFNVYAIACYPRILIGCSEGLYVFLTGN